MYVLCMQVRVMYVRMQVYPHRMCSYAFARVVYACKYV